MSSATSDRLLSPEAIKQRSCVYFTIMQELEDILASRCCDDEDDRHAIAHRLAQRLEEVNYHAP